MQVITEFPKRDCMAFWGQTFVWKMGKRETITFLNVKNIYTTLKRSRYSEMLINTGYLHVIFCHIHSYNANDIDRCLYLLFCFIPFLFAKISTRTSFTIIVPSTFLWPSHSHLRNYKSKYFQIKKDNNNCYKMFVVTSD